MNILQIIIVTIWVAIYIIPTIFAIKDLIKGEFIIKNGSSNLFTACWVAMTIIVLITLTFFGF
jgi:hypothetical protein